VPQLSEAGAHGAAQLLGPGRRDHAAGGPLEERISEDCAQAGQGVAHRRLAEADPRGGATDATFIQQGFERDQQVQIDGCYIHSVNVRRSHYPYHK
jgi:hypothetical protein